jgi:hypothetical protein
LGHINQSPVGLKTKECLIFDDVTPRHNDWTHEWHVGFIILAEYARVHMVALRERSKLQKSTDLMIKSID